MACPRARAQDGLHDQGGGRPRASQLEFVVLRKVFGIGRQLLSSLRRHDLGRTGRNGGLGQRRGLRGISLKSGRILAICEL